MRILNIDAHTVPSKSFDSQCSAHLRQTQFALKSRAKSPVCHLNFCLTVLQAPSTSQSPGKMTPVPIGSYAATAIGHGPWNHQARQLDVSLAQGVSANAPTFPMLQQHLNHGVLWSAMECFLARVLFHMFLSI